MRQSSLLHLFWFSIFNSVLATSLSAQSSFKDVTTEAGLEVPNAAVCWADLNRDGWPDLCAAGSVWKNNQGQGFTRIADGMGCCVAADFDNDGLVDLFSWSNMKLYRNVDGKQWLPFELPELPKTTSRGACWGDFNGDGFVDLYIGGYEDWGSQTTWPLLILINQQGKRFEIKRNEVKFRTRGVTACDFDGDGDLDVYASNYRLQPNLLWVNNGQAEFEDRAAELGVVATSGEFKGGHSIGAAWGDFNNDGQLDLFAGNFAHVDARGDQPKSRFLQNLGPEQNFRFEDKGTCGVYYQESYATPAVADFDNDGWLDLFFTTVYGTASFGRPNHPVMFRNLGQFSMDDVSDSAGLSKLPATYQAAWADYDGDGDLDLVTAGKLFQNQGNEHAWIRVRLQGDGKIVNRSAIGSQVRIQVNGQTLCRQVEAGTGEGNQNDLTLHFGLGDIQEPVNLEIRWPHQANVQQVSDVPVNQEVKIDFQPSSKGKAQEPGSG